MTKIDKTQLAADREAIDDLVYESREEMKNQIDVLFEIEESYETNPKLKRIPDNNRTKVLTEISYLISTIYKNLPEYEKE